MVLISQTGISEVLTDTVHGASILFDLLSDCYYPSSSLSCLLYLVTPELTNLIKFNHELKTQYLTAYWLPSYNRRSTKPHQRVATSSLSLSPFLPIPNSTPSTVELNSMNVNPTRCRSRVSHPSGNLSSSNQILRSLTRPSNATSKVEALLI